MLKLTSPMCTFAKVRLLSVNLKQEQPGTTVLAITSKREVVGIALFQLHRSTCDNSQNSQ